MLEPVIGAAFRREDVDDELDVIEEYPAVAFSSLRMTGTLAFNAQAFGHAVGQCAHMQGRATARDHKIIRER